MWISLVSPVGWFTHAKVRVEGADRWTTLATTIAGRPRYEKKNDGRPRLMKMPAVPVPGGAKYVEISKGRDVQCFFTEVSFEEAPPEEIETWRQVAEGGRERRPIVFGIIDHGICVNETIHSSDRRDIADLYHQFSDMGFTHWAGQVYAGSADWSEVAKARGPMPARGHSQHVHYYHHWEDAVEREGLGLDTELTHEAGMKYCASFRLNNEWLADWVREYWPDGSPEASVFSVEHPEWWCSFPDGTRQGGGMDFYYEGVRDHRLAVINEYIDKFPAPDVVCLDMHRHATLVSYAPEMCEEYVNETGVDPRKLDPDAGGPELEAWHRYRARYFTQFVRDARALVGERLGPEVKIAARINNDPARALREGCDFDVWLEEGLADVLLLSPYFSVWKWQETAWQEMVRRGSAAGTACVNTFPRGFYDFPDPDIGRVMPYLEAWREAGAAGFGFYEAERAARDGRWRRGMPQAVARWNEVR
jgi:hypothetical protein